MMRELIDLVSAWWRRDRIRVRISDGRLLRLGSGAVLYFSVAPGTKPISATIVCREEVNEAEPPSVRYVCQTNVGDGELVVTYLVDRQPAIQWRVDNEIVELDVGDIEAFQPQRGRRVPRQAVVD